MSSGLIVFVVTYALISARRLDWIGIDRPSGALVGAVACVALSVLAPAQALAAVDGQTLLLLFGVMGMGAFLALDGLFESAGARLVTIARTPARLLGIVVWSAGLLAPLITNDAVCVLGAPLVVELVRRQRLPPLPFLLALATAANTGSVATLVGNPQNMLCASLGQLSYREHLLLLGPVAIGGLALNHLLLWLMFRRRLGERLTPEPNVARLNHGSKVTFAIIALTAGGCMLGWSLPFTVTGGTLALLLVHRGSAPRVWERIDWSILLFFAGLFVVVEGFVRTGYPAAFFERYPLYEGSGVSAWLRVAGIFLLGSNVVSNVPFILVVRDAMATLPDQKLGWELLAMASTFAGNLTFLGSVANVIVAEKSREVGSLGFWDYLVIGFPLAVASTLAGTLWLVLVL